jgi:SulP family sulfate permease
MPQLPMLSPEKIVALLPAAAAFAFLGSIESLLSAVVADSLSGGRHRSNAELVAQGVANIISSLFGGICVTGTIARTATNVRAGAKGPFSGMFHAGFVLLFILVAAPLAGYIPLAALAAVLAVVCWNMAEKRQFIGLLKTSLGDAAVLLATFLTVIFRDLTSGIVVGFLLGSLLFIHRMSHEVDVWEDEPDVIGGRGRYDNEVKTDPDIVVYRMSGAFFFGAAANVEDALDRIGAHPKAYVIDFSAVSVIDSTASTTIAGFVRKVRRQGAVVYVAGARPEVRKLLQAHGAEEPAVAFAPDVAEARHQASRALGT